MTYDELIGALMREGTLAADAVRDLPEAEFGLPSRCQPWDVKALMAHLWRDVDRVAEFLDGPTPSEVDGDLITYWRVYDPKAEGPLISARTYEVADRFGTGADLVRSFQEHLAMAAEMAAGLDPSRPIRTRLQTMRLDDFIKTRVLELAVHGLDLARALNRDPWLTPDGARVTIEILEGLMDIPLPPELGWDDVTFIETGTGRRPLQESEREVLGARAERFPLIG